MAKAPTDTATETQPRKKGRLDEEEESAADEESAAEGGSKRRLIIIGGVAAAVLAGGGAAGFFLLRRKAPEKAPEDQEPTAKSTNKPPTYVKLDPFTTNLAPDEGKPDQYVQVTIELRVDEETSGDLIKQYMPDIRDRILRFLSARKASDLATPDGKDTLAEQIRSTVNTIVDGAPGRKGDANHEGTGTVQSVSFSSFIIQ